MENQAELDRRKAYVDEHVDGYRELSDAIVHLSMEGAKQLLNGESNTTDDLKETISDLVAQKRALLKSASLPEDYLDPIFTCKDCKDTGYIDGEKCHCLKQFSVNI